ncbi:hypothetical protein HPB51_014623 [Rhipicephalus microplus]|uniref:Carboxylesterase type B domain-containing protein n=1 Tax=Rhipicephalus microplus TaxID=6941 RepID=A0A9J6F3F4_RHIMP|nr:hypothetical protein HPB51_014623 [Rhipicephalus microplus]
MGDEEAGDKEKENGAGDKDDDDDDDDAGGDDGAPKGKRPPDSIMVQRKSARGSQSSAGSSGKTDSDAKSTASMIITIGGLLIFAAVVLGVVGFIVYKITQSTEAGSNGSVDDGGDSVVSFFNKIGAQKEDKAIASSIWLPSKSSPSTGVLPSPLCKSSHWMNLLRFLSTTSSSAMLAWKRLNTGAANIGGNPNDVDSSNAFLISAFNDSNLRALSTSLTPEASENKRIISREELSLRRKTVNKTETVYETRSRDFAVNTTKGPIIGRKRKLHGRDPVDGWNIALDVSKAGVPCYHLASPHLDEHQESNSHASRSPSKDYLQVNVWAPLCNVSPCSGLTVVAFIHEGGPRVGGNVDRRPDGSVLVTQGHVVVVVPHYQLDMSGFASRDIVGAARNPGILDIVMALDWAREGIAVFCWNAKNVVLFGSGWGSYLAGLFIVSLKLKSYSRTSRIILGSVSPLLKSNHEHQTEEHWTGFFIASGCDHTEENATLECLRNATASSIAEGQEQFPGTVRVLFPDDFVLPEPPEEFVAEVRPYSSVEAPLSKVISEGRAQYQRLFENKSDGANLNVESFMNAVRLAASQLAYHNYVELQGGLGRRFEALSAEFPAFGDPRTNGTSTVLLHDHAIRTGG